MNKRRVLLALLFFLLAGACALPGLALPGDLGTLTLDPAAATANALLTQQVLETVRANMSITPAPVDQETFLTATLAPSSTPLTPTATGTRRPPTSTPLPPTATPLPCYKARFVADVTILDGAIINAGTEFTKTWVLMNDGSCIWTTDFSVIYDSGETMGVTDPTDLPKIVLPGAMVTVSVKMTAPAEPGSYIGNFKLRTDGGAVFGVGADASKPFWVRINVVKKGTKPGEVYNLTNDYCSAVWISETAAPLKCPSVASKDGGVFWVKDFIMENHQIEDEAAIFTIPSDGKNGFIQGIFPPVQVRAGNKFTAVIGCGGNSDDCTVTFELAYTTDGITFTTLGSWVQKSDGKLNTLAVDLSPFADKSIQLVLKVLDNGDATEDRAFWLQPRVMR